MNSMPRLPLIKYGSLVKALRTNTTLMNEIPVEFARSLPLPTMRWGQPAWAFFAAPAVRVPGKPHRQGPPTIYAVIAARSADPGGDILLCSHTDAVPFAAAPLHEQELPPNPMTIQQMKEHMRAIEPLMDQAAELFFDSAAQPAAKAAHQALLPHWQALVPRQLWPHYGALVPDFWSWLGIGSTNA